jgi:hypothetical protein
VSNLGCPRDYLKVLERNFQPGHRLGWSMSVLLITLRTLRSYACLIFRMVETASYAILWFSWIALRLSQLSQEPGIFFL